MVKAAFKKKKKKKKKKKTLLISKLDLKFKNKTRSAGAYRCMMLKLGHFGK
jgi:hypothetical protein